MTSVWSDTRLTVDEPWEETSFETGTYGPDGREGLEATLSFDAGTLRVLPVQYLYDDGEETITALTDSIERSASHPGLPRTTAGPLTAFGVYVSYTHLGSTEGGWTFIATDPDDALAIAVWLTHGTESAKDLRRRMEARLGIGGSRPALSSDEHLDALFVTEPTRCALTGKRTKSHRLELPYRYLPLFQGAMGDDTPPFPSTCRTLYGVVSHAAWEEHDLTEDGFQDGLTRTKPGAYEAREREVELARSIDAGRLSLERIRPWM